MDEQNARPKGTRRVRNPNSVDGVYRQSRRTTSANTTFGFVSQKGPDGRDRTEARSRPRGARPHRDGTTGLKVAAVTDTLEGVMEAAEEKFQRRGTSAYRRKIRRQRQRARRAAIEKAAAAIARHADERARVAENTPHEEPVWETVKPCDCHNCRERAS